MQSNTKKGMGVVIYVNMQKYMEIQYKSLYNSNEMELGITLLVQKILFYACQTLLLLAFLKDSAKAMENVCNRLLVTNYLNI